MNEQPQGITVPLLDILDELFSKDIWDDSSADTANRIIRAWKEFVPPDEMPFKVTTFPSIGQQMIVVKDIEFVSLCAHHLFPFYGKAHVAYLPHALQIGLSKIPRIVEFYAKRPSVQERITYEVGHFIKSTLQAKGVALVIEGRHTCMSCRGIQQHNASMITSYIRGVFLTAPAARHEFMSIIGMTGGLG